jgi:hypothetical protein
MASPIEALIMAAEASVPTMHARIGIMKALQRHVERVFNPDRKPPLLFRTQVWTQRSSQGTPPLAPPVPSSGLLISMSATELRIAQPPMPKTG